MRPLTMPRYVEVAQEVMQEYFGLDLWEMQKRHRDRLILAACDAETMGEPEDLPIA